MQVVAGEGGSQRALYQGVVGSRNIPYGIVLFVVDGAGERAPLELHNVLNSEQLVRFKRNRVHGNGFHRLTVLVQVLVRIAGPARGQFRKAGVVQGVEEPLAVGVGFPRRNTCVCIAPDKRHGSVGIVPSVLNGNAHVVRRGFEFFRFGKVYFFDHTPVGNDGHVVVGQALSSPDATQLSALFFPSFAHGKKLQDPDFIGIGQGDQLGVFSAGRQKTVCFHQVGHQFQGFPGRFATLQRKGLCLFYSHNLIAFTFSQFQFRPLVGGTFPNAQLVLVDLGIGRMKIRIRLLYLRDIPQNFPKIVCGTCIFQQTPKYGSHGSFFEFLSGDNAYAVIGTTICVGIEYTSVCRGFLARYHNGAGKTVIP